MREMCVSPLKHRAMRCYEERKKVARFDLIMFQDSLFALFHQPFWRTGGAANANGAYPFKPVKVYLLSAFYLITVGVDAPTFVEKHLAIGALRPLTNRMRSCLDANSAMLGMRLAT